MDSKALEGSFSIFIMFIILLLPISYYFKEFLTQNEQITIVIVLIIIIIVGIVNGYIYRDHVKKAILYLVGIGEVVIVGLFILSYNSLLNQSNSSNTGLEGLGLIFVFIILVALLIAGFVGLLLFGVIIYIPAIIGKNLNKNKSR